jgi:hypothetical protein
MGTEPWLKNELFPKNGDPTRAAPDGVLISVAKPLSIWMSVCGSPRAANWVTGCAVMRERTLGADSQNGSPANFSE